MRLWEQKSPKREKGWENFFLPQKIKSLFVDIKTSSIFLITQQQAMNEDFNSPQTSQSQRPVRYRPPIRNRKYRSNYISNYRQDHFTMNSGTWNLDETIKYIAFLNQNFQHFEDNNDMGRVFSLMAEAISSRTVLQCRTHHQKMVKTLGRPENIISHYENNVIPYYEAEAKERKVPKRLLRLRTQPHSMWLLTQRTNSKSSLSFP